MEDEHLNVGFPFFGFLVDNDIKGIRIFLPRKPRFDSYTLHGRTRSNSGTAQLGQSLSIGLEDS